jgi:hypothetical protein
VILAAVIPWAVTITAGFFLLSLVADDLRDEARRDRDRARDRRQTEVPMAETEPEPDPAAPPPPPRSRRARLRTPVHCGLVFFGAIGFLHVLTVVGRALGHPVEPLAGWGTAIAAIATAVTQFVCAVMQDAVVLEAPARPVASPKPTPAPAPAAGPVPQPAIPRAAGPAPGPGPAPAPSPFPAPRPTAVQVQTP